MIKKLRIKLVAASMLSLLIVLAVIMGIVGMLNYREIVEDADSTLAILAANEGSFPGGAETLPEKNGQDGADGAAPPENAPRGKRQVSPELPYESRYFSVLLDSDGNVLSTDMKRIAAVDEDTAIVYANSIFTSGKERGFVSAYRYVLVTSDEGTRVIFLDCGRSLDTFRNFAVTGVGVAAAGLLAVFLLMIVLSGRIVKPFSESYEKQKRFITDAGHELKTPLTIINADTEILGMDFGDNEWLDDIRSQTGRLTELTNSLILLSRMEEEQAQYQMIEFPLSDVVEESAHSFRNLALTQQKTLSSEIQPMISFCGDENSIRRLVGILLDNAVKYCTEQGEIRLTLEKQKNAVRLSVYNTSEPVSEEQLAHLFDRFYRTDSSRNSRTGGYGLGLSIAAAIVRVHKGKIWAATEDGRSLIITVTLPQ
ncbi:MAG: HAMP domain-containing histidine kinase [Lachnospiraceae bacterium]|nr:HAMP domain-containing histidine kinase [Lachnospiraceae bacterium]